MKVADIFVGIGGSTAGLTSALTKGIDGLNKFGKSALSLKNIMIGMGAALVGGAVVNGIKSFVASGLDAIDNQNKMARNIGISSERFAELNYIAGLSGVEMETLGAAFTKLGVNLSSGSKGARDAVAELGLSFDDLQGGSVESAFDKIHGALSKIESPAKKNALAMELFSKAGLGIRGILNTAPEDIAAMSAEARKLGLSFSELAGNQVEAANDAISKVGLSIQGIAQMAAIRLAPSIQAVADITVEWLVGARDEAANLTGYMQTLADITDFWINLGASALVGIIAGFSTLGLAVLTVGANLATVIDALTGSNLAESLTASRDKLFADTQAAVDGLMNFESNIGNNAALNEMKSRIEALSATAQKEGPAIGQALDEGLNKAIESASDYKQKLEEQIATFGMSAANAEAYKLSLEGVDSATTEQIKRLGEELEQLNAVQDIQKRLKDDAAKLKEDIASPFESLEKKLHDIQILFNEGLINEDEFKASIDKMASEVEHATFKPQFASVSLKGSQSARDDILRHKNPQIEKQNEWQRKQFEEQKRANEYLRKLSEGTAQEAIENITI